MISYQIFSNRILITLDSKGTNSLSIFGDKTRLHCITLIDNSLCCSTCHFIQIMAVHMASIKLKDSDDATVVCDIELHSYGDGGMVK